MKDVIEEQRKALLEYFTYPDDARLKINEAFLRIANEADFIINRLQGEAGLIERAAAKLPKTAHLLKAQATIMRGYAARIEDSQAPEFQRTPPVSNIITPPGFNGS